MTITEKDLFLAILAMDSYNRGSGAGINDGGSGDTDGLGASGQIGTATINFDSGVLTSGGVRLDEPAGFYAVAYTMSGGSTIEGLAPGTTVISYRGTDSTPAGDTTTDATRGWPLGGGDYFTPQTALSIDFLDAVQTPAPRCCG